MKILELVTKVKSLSMEEIDELVDNNIEIEDIEYILLNDDEDIRKILFKNEKLKQYILKYVNMFVDLLFKKINKNPDMELPDKVKNISENYAKNYFKEGIELGLGSKVGDSIVRTMIRLKNANSFFTQIYKENKIWSKYCAIIRNIAQKDVLTMSKEDVAQTDKVLTDFFGRIILGYDIPEVETALKITQRDDMDIAKKTALDIYTKRYEIEKTNPNSKMIKKDEVFSIVLDYDMILKQQGIEKEGQYSPIKEMQNAIREGKFGESNILSKEEFAFVLKSCENGWIGIIEDDEIFEKLCETLDNQNIELNIGDREINTLLCNKELFKRISYVFPTFENRILKKLDEHIYSILQDIASKKRKITPEEMSEYSSYLKHYFESSVEKNYETIEMSQLFCLANDLGNPNVRYNMIKLKKQEETVEFLEKEFDENKIFEKYFSQISKITEKLLSDEIITQEEFEKYDEIFYQASYRRKINHTNNINAMQALNKKSKDLGVTSKTIENEIEIYIDKSIRGVKVPDKQSFYETINEYYQKLLQGSAIEISDNAAISHLIRAAQKGKLPQDIATLILDELEERKQKKTISQINNTDDLDKYMQNAAEFRLQQGRMPRECSEFIIKQAILKEPGMDKYTGMIERALEDFSEYQLETSKINDYFITVENKPFLDSETVNGVQYEKYKTIILSRQVLQEKGMLKILETSLHECTHAEQDSQIKNVQLNTDTYKMLKEVILRRENKEFYNTNYKYMYNEIDARKGGYIKRLQTLRRIGLTDTQIVELQAGNIKQIIDEYCKFYEQGKVKKVGQETKDVNIIFLELLQEKPELLEKYPELGFEFEKNGDNVERRYFADILQIYEQNLNLAKDQTGIARISSLYSEILLNSGPITEERLEDELEKLIAFKSDNPIINAYKNKVLTTKFPKEKVMSLTMKKMYENHSEQERKAAQHEMKHGVKSNDKQNQTQQGANNEGRNE